MIEDVATSPERIAAEIHRQLGAVPAPIPVKDIAHALDIVEIRERPLKGFEAALVTGPERDEGLILINTGAGPRRQRYSIAHELGHFLCGWHEEVDAKGFLCTRRDMRLTIGADLHARQEAEANSFAIELLAPARLMAPYIRRLPELEQVIALSKELHISKAAAARRYIGLHRQPLAVIFASQNRFLYACRHPAFPWLSFVESDSLPELPSDTTDGLSEMIEAEAGDWRLPDRKGFYVQVLYQASGYAMILLAIDEP
jgi:hypothetical protein